MKLLHTLFFVPAMAAAIAPLERWEFTSCPKNREYWSVVANSTVNALISDKMSSFACDYDFGITTSKANIIQSSSSSSYLKTPIDRLQENFQAFNASALVGLSVAAWIRPSSNTNSPHPQPIITFGILERVPEWNPACPGYVLEIAQYRDNLLIRYADQDSASSCRVAWLKHNTLSADNVTHISVSISDKYTNIYLDGEAIAWNITNQFDTTLSTWDDNNYLQLLGNAQSDAVFSGSILQLDIYDTALSVSETRDLYLNGVAYGSVEPFNLFAVDPEPFVVTQETELPQIIKLEFANDTDFYLGLQLVELPENGQISTMYGENIVKAGSIVPVTYGSTFGYIRYKAHNRSYYNYPTHNLLGEDLDVSPESIQYRFVASNRGGRILDTTPTIALPIIVRHVNHAPKLIVPDQAFVGQAVDDPTLVLVQGIMVDDSLDRDIDYVRVDVSANLGKITLQPDYLSLALFDFCSQRSYSAWQCVGNGTDDRFMTFLAIPSHIASILNKLEYRGYTPGQPDEIVISIYDGTEGNCLSAIEHQNLTNHNGSEHRGCNIVNAAITVPEFGYQMRDESEEKNILGIPNTDFSNFGVADLMYWIVFFVFLCGCVGCAQTCSRCKANGAKIEVDGNSNYSSSYISDSDSPESGEVSDKVASPQAVETTPDLEATTEDREASLTDKVLTATGAVGLDNTSVVVATASKDEATVVEEAQRIDNENDFV